MKLLFYGQGFVYSFKEKQTKVLKGKYIEIFC